MEYPINQSSWKRATKDTATAQRTAWFVWGGEGVLAVAGGMWLALVAPPNATNAELIIRTVIGGVGGLAVAVILIFAFNLLATPYKQRNEARHLLSEIPSKRKVIADRLAHFYLSGNELKTKMAEKGFNEDAISLVKDWVTPLKEYCYTEPDILGVSALVALSPKNKDWLAYGHVYNRLPDNERDYAFLHLLIQLEKLLDLIMELRK